MCSEFDDIRPYDDGEIPEAMQRIAEWDLFPQVVRFIYPDRDIEEARQSLLKTASVRDFQASFMRDAICRIITETTDGFTFGGLHNLKRGEPYIFVSNHRDITLDAFLLQYLLLEHRGQTSHIVFGQNLLAMPIIEVLFRCNKLIRMERGGSPRAFYNSLRHLSLYLNQLVVDERQSVWIAQRNGRAKDGIDTTAPAIIKMLAMGSDEEPLTALERLHLVPMSISYEWDPCDTLKARELYLSRSGTYRKAPGEDMHSVITGIVGKKGRVHLEVGRPLTRRDLLPAEGEDLFDHVAAVLDRRIRGGYHLMPTNYAACQLTGRRSAHGRFTQRTVNDLKARAEELPEAEMRQLLMESYAAPALA